MKINVLLYGMLLSVLSASCYKEEELKSSNEPENVYGEYTLPQGDHDYDNQIVEYFKKYNVIILYKFRDRDYWWNSTSDIRWVYNPEINLTHSGYEATPADTLYIGDQLDLLQDKFFKYFPDSLLNRALPSKILLSSMFNFVPTTTGLPLETDRKLVNLYSGYDYLGVNWGNEKIRTMTHDQKNAFKGEACYVFLKRLFDKKQMSYSTDFIGITDYSQRVTNANLYELGYVISDATSPSKDWVSYIDLIVHTSYETLTEEDGVLNSKVDVSGKIKQKYDIIIDYFKSEYNIDLQAIGNDIEK